MIIVHCCDFMATLAILDVIPMQHLFAKFTLLRLLRGCLNGGPERAKARCQLLMAVTDWDRSTIAP